MAVGNLGPARNHPFLKPRMYLKLVLRTEAVFLWEKRIFTIPVQKAKSNLASSAIPPPAVARPASAKQFLMGWERCAKQYEVRTHVKDR